MTKQNISIVSLILLPFMLTNCGENEPDNVGTGGAGGVEVSTSNSSSTGCVSKSCKDIGAECGTIDDGCGNEIECGVCDLDSKNECGTRKYELGSPIPISPNTCGGGCLAMTTSESLFDCAERNPLLSYYWWCSPVGTKSVLLETSGLRQAAPCDGVTIVSRNDVLGQGWCCKYGVD